MFVANFVVQLDNFWTGGRFPKGRKSSNFVTILMKRTRLLNLKDMFRQLLCHRQFTDGITMMNNI